MTLAKVPLKTGRIVFVPLGTGAAGQVTITEGTFALDAALGLSPGGYRVEIYSPEPTGKKIYDQTDNMMVDEVRDLVPRAYNVDSKLQVDVKAGELNTFDFDVESPRKP